MSYLFISEKKNFFLLMLLIFFSFLLQAQPENEWVLKKNRWNISYTGGVMKPEFIGPESILKPTALYGGMYEIDLGYTFMIKNVGITISTGIGKLPFRYELHEAFAAEGYVIKELSTFSYQQPFHQAGLEVSYHHWLGKRWQLKGTLGGNYRYFVNSGGGVRGQFGQLYTYTGHIFVKRHKFVAFAEVGIERLLKNDDLLGVHLGYRRALTPYIENGLYYTQLDGVEEIGPFRASGHYPSLSLTYSLTGARKRNKLESLYK